MAKSKTILIQGGNAVLGQIVAKQDILIQGEKIRAIGTLQGHKADLVVDAKGLLVLPGAVDTHVHFNDEFMNTVSVHDYYSGTRAAAFGGVTSIVDFSNQIPGEALVQTIDAKKEEAKGKAIIDWGVHPVLTKPTAKVLKEIPLLVQKGAPTIKCYMTYRAEGLMVGDKDLKRIMEALKNAGGMLLVHAEDNDTIEKNVPRMIKEGLTKPIFHARSRPPDSEAKAIQRCIQLARETRARLFIVHMASASGVELVGQARGEGYDVIAETCTHYLIFTDRMLLRDDGIKWICSPPLRNPMIQDWLWRGIRDGRISLVTSDDAAYSWDAKLYGADRFDKCPNGIPGIEVRLPLLYSEGVAKGHISLPRLVELISTHPALLFGLAPRKGTLAPGSDADIVLFDPKARWTMNQESLHMASDWSAYENIPITGKIVKVFSRGDLIIDGDRCLARKGRGRYLHRRLDPSVRAFVGSPRLERSFFQTDEGLYIK
ncbi:MAG: dihydropyrimidinase [Candidatus Aminicenantes bacterium]|nr:MAG: dihydropyrimidinase [Candidatus Aminicenantes bacterium]